VLFSGGGAATAVAVNATDVFWVGNSGILRESKAGGSVSTILPSALGGLGRLAVTADTIYFGDSEPCQGADCTLIGQIQRIPAGGGAVVMLASTVDKEPHRLAIDDDRVYWTSQDVVPPGQLPLGSVMRVSFGGGDAEVISGGQTPRG